VTFARGGYAWWSRRPLHMLVFLAPLIAAYEIGSVWLMRRGEGVNPISAERILADVFDLFGGQTGLHFPAALIVVTLLIEPIGSGPDPQGRGQEADQDGPAPPRQDRDPDADGADRRDQRPGRQRRGLPDPPVRPRAVQPQARRSRWTSRATTACS
jgi:hypothetical protein